MNFGVHTKIQLGVFEQLVRNPTCRHILFGACHDNGYVRMLEDFAEDVAIIERVTLLRSFSFGREFDRLPFQTTRMDTIFRSASPGVPSPTATTGNQDIPRTDNAQATTQVTWASLARRDSGSGEASVSSPTATVLVNAAGQRVDEKLCQPSQATMNKWTHKVKVMKTRYCRVYHLDGSCQGGCGYSHAPLSKEEKLAYRRNVRAEVCHTGLKCRDIHCHYGHNCSCNRQWCKFPREMHGVTVDTAEVWRG